jgi:hypothetical protein
MGRLLIVALAMAAIISQVRAQEIATPSTQGGAPPPEPTSQSSGSTLTSPGLSQYQRYTLPEPTPNGVDQPSAAESRQMPEQPERPAGPER